MRNLVAALSVLLVGCGAPNQNAPTKNASKAIQSPSKTEEAARLNPQLNKAGKLETKEQPRKPEEVAATVRPQDADKAIACLNQSHISSKAQKDGDLVDIFVKQADVSRAGALLLADSQEKGYPLNPNASSPIRPDMPQN